MTVLLLLLAALAGALAVAAWVRTPEYDRPRMYPRQPERWAGITGQPAELRHALSTVLFWALAVFGLGVGGAVVSVIAPGQPFLALGVGGACGALTAVGT